jgi:SRSO17 transposase
MPGPSAEGWEQELERWLEPFLQRLRRKAQRRWAPFYLKGLILPGERKSIEPMAARVAPGDTQQLHHFVSTSPWAAAPLEDELVKTADRLVGGPDAVLVIDDTALVKQGKHSVGVKRQYCGQLGKRANCQALVSLTLARAEVPVCVGLRLFLPEDWCADDERRARAGVPEGIVHRPKWRIALEEIDRVLASGARFGCVLADAEYGKAAEFRAGLNERHLAFAVGVLPTQKVYPADVTLAWPERKATGRPRKHPVPSVASVAVAKLIEARPEAFRILSWRTGTKGPLKAAFAAIRVRVADGPAMARGQHLPGEEAWLIGEHRTNGERKHYLANHPSGTPLEVLAGLIKARWICEQMHQQMKEELGLDHFEGRSWRGLHHHALLCQLAFAFLQHLRLGGKKHRGRDRRRTAAVAKPARHPPPHPGGGHACPPMLPALPATLRPSSPALKWQGSVSQVSLIQLGRAQVGFVQLGCDQVSLVQLGPAQVGLVQVGPAQLGLIQLGVAQISLVQLGRDQIGLVQLGSAQVGFLEVGSSKIALLARAVAGRAEVLHVADIVGLGRSNSQQTRQQGILLIAQGLSGAEIADQGSALRCPHGLPPGRAVPS